MSKILVLIDADGLAYHALRETLEESLTALDEKIQNIFEKTECTHYCMFISKGKYFRHEISKGTYKANRNKYQRQNWVKTLKAVLEDKYGATYMPGVEADDLVAYWNKNINSKLKKIGKEGFDEIILCSPDKDLLNSISSNN